MAFSAVIICLIPYLHLAMQWPTFRKGCPHTIENILAQQSLSRFKPDPGSVDSIITYSYCRVFSPSFQKALRSTNPPLLPKVPSHHFLNITNPLVFSFDDKTVAQFTNTQISALLESPTLGTVAKADLLARNWGRADIQGVLDISKSSNHIWQKRIVKTSILYQTSYYKRDNSIQCFWERSFRSENSVFNEDLRIQNIEGTTIRMIDTFPKCSITFHLVAWGKLSQTPLEAPKCRRLFSVSKQQRLTSITSEDKDIFTYQCVTLPDITFQNTKSQIKLIKNVQNVQLPKILGAQILYDNVKFLDGQLSSVLSPQFFKYTTIKELQLTTTNFYRLKSYHSDVLVPFSRSKNLFHQSLAAFTHSYQRTPRETLNFPSIFGPEWLVQMLQEKNVIEANSISPEIHADTLLSTSQKRALLFNKVSFFDITNNGDGLSVSDFKILTPNLVSGIPLEILEKSSETIFKSSSSFEVKQKLKLAAESMSDVQKVTILNLCQKVLRNDCMTQSAYKIGLEYFDMIPVQELVRRLDSQKMSGFSLGLSDLGIYRYPDGSFQINHRELIKFNWSKQNLLAVAKRLQQDIGRKKLFSSESLQSIGVLALGITARDILMTPFMDAFDLVEVFSSNKLIHPTNVRIFSQLLDRSFTTLFHPAQYHFLSLPPIFLELIDGFLLSRFAIAKWKTLEKSSSAANEIEETDDSSLRHQKASLCRQLVAKISGSEYFDFMESEKKRNSANFYLLHCRYDMSEEKQPEVGLVESDLDILQKLICYVDYSVLRFTDVKLLKKHSHLLQNCCLTSKQSQTLNNLFFQQSVSPLFTELVVDHYRFVTSLGNSAFDILGADLNTYLNNSKDAVLELYQNLNSESRVSKCAHTTSEWDHQRFWEAEKQADVLAQEYLKEMTQRVTMPCYFPISQSLDTLTCTFVMGMEKHLHKIEASLFSKWASDCEILNCVEFLGKRNLSLEQKMSLKPAIENIFSQDSSYQTVIIPSFNRLGFLLEVYTPQELENVIDFNDFDTIADLSLLNFWSISQSRSMLEKYIAVKYEAPENIHKLTKVDILILKNFLCSLREEELASINKIVIQSSVNTLGILECFTNSQKSVILSTVLQERPNKADKMISPSEVASFGNLISVFDSCCMDSIPEILTEDNVNVISPTAFKTMSQNAILEILAGRSHSLSETTLSDYVTLEQLLVLRDRSLADSNAEIASLAEALIDAEPRDSNTIKYEYKIFIPEENEDGSGSAAEDKDDSRNSLIYDDATDWNGIDGAENDFQYSHIVYIYASSQNFGPNFSTFCFIFPISLLFHKDSQF